MSLPARAPRALGPRSLTARLVVGVCTLVVVLVTIIGTATYYAQRSFLYDRLDQQLAPIAAGNAQFLERCLTFGEDGPGCGLRGSNSYQAAATEWLNAYALDGSSVITTLQGEGLKKMLLTKAQAMSLLADHPSGRSLTTVDGSALRVTARTINSPSGVLVVVTGLSVGDVHTTLRRLVFIELIIGLLAVLLAFVATSVGVRFSLRNLRRVTTTAQDVAAELSPEGAGLDRRVPVMERGTEVGQLAESMNTLLGAVETQFGARLESEHRMRQFLADASHELRTPLTSIRGYAELARMQRAVGENAEDNLDRIESEGTRMSRLVEDLLVLARGDSDDHAMRADLVDLADLLEEVADSARAAYPDRQIDVAVDASPPVSGDRDQLLRAVRNLVTNAAVHTSGTISLRGRADADGAVIQVVDAGPGLAPGDAAHVFERFWRADKARTRARGGSGLGLSIVASIVRAHGGTVRFDSSIEQGSTVTMWLPAAQPA